MADDVLVEVVRNAEAHKAAIERVEDRARERHETILRLHGEHAEQHEALTQTLAEVQEAQTDAIERLDRLEQRIPAPPPTPRTTGPLQALPAGGDHDPTGPVALPRPTDAALTDTAGSALGQLFARRLTWRTVLTVAAWLFVGGGGFAAVQAIGGRVGCSVPHGEVAVDAGVQLGEELELAPLGEIYAEARRPKRPPSPPRADAGAHPPGPEPAPRPDPDHDAQVPSGTPAPTWRWINCDGSPREDTRLCPGAAKKRRRVGP